MLGIMSVTEITAGFTAVSYTHLDVYKRQLLRRDKLLRHVDYAYAGRFCSVVNVRKAVTEYPLGWTFLRHSVISGIPTSET